MKRFIFIIITILIPAFALAHFNGFGNSGWGHHMGGMFGFGGGFMMILFYIIIIFLIISFVKDFFRKRNAGSDVARQILKERFAKGEITLSEYEDMKKHV